MILLNIIVRKQFLYLIFGLTGTAFSIASFIAITSINTQIAKKHS